MSNEVIIRKIETKGLIGFEIRKRRLTSLELIIRRVGLESMTLPRHVEGKTVSENAANKLHSVKG